MFSIIQTLIRKLQQYRLEREMQISGLDYSTGS